MGVLQSLQIGSRALHASETALQIVGNNTSNVNTPFYSRQAVNLQNSSPELLQQGVYVGRGAQVGSVTRTVDNYLLERFHSAESTSQYLSTEETSLTSLENIFNSLSDNDLTTNMNDFFNALEDVSQTPENTSVREAFIGKAESLADFFQTTATQVQSIRSSIDQNVSPLVEKVNSLLDQIQSVNKEIFAAEGGGTSNNTANDLRDQRDSLLHDLSGLVDVKTVEQQNGTMDIYAGGEKLIDGDKVTHLGSTERFDQGIYVHDITLEGSTSVLTFKSGQIQGMIDSRDTYAGEIQTRIDKLARAFIFEFNKIQSTGMGIEGLTDVTSTEQVSSSVAALSSSIQSKSGTDPYPVQNGSFDLVLTNQQTQESQSFRINIDLDGHDNDDTSLQDVANQINTTDSGARGDIVASVENGKLRIKTSSSVFTFSFSNDTSNLLAALGINTFFVGTDARSMMVNSALKSNPDYFAAGQTLGTGDNSNALKMLDLRDATNADLGRTLSAYHEDTVNGLGQDLATVKSKNSTQSLLLTQLSNERDQVSGVSVDEEAIDMIKYQRSYQASAKFITTVNSLLETLINSL